MVNDFKYIIKRILIGVGIALVLMYLKGGLILQAHAKSCGYSGTQNNTVLGAIETGKISIVQNNSNSMTTVIYTLGNNDNGKLYLHDHDYYILHVPSAFIFTYLNNTSYGTANQTIQVMGLLCTKAHGCYNADIEQGGMYFKIDKDIEVASIRFRVMSGNYNFQAQGDLAQFGNIWNQDFYDCSNDDALLQEQEKTNDLLEDDSIDTNKTDSDINNMNSKVASNNSITQLLTLPITLYQSILNATSGSCSPISLGSLYNHSLSLPCINLSNLLGSTLYNIIDILCSGLFILAFRKKMVDIFNHMTSLNDRGNELE